MNKNKYDKSKTSDKFLFPSLFVNKISSRFFSLILAILALGTLNALPYFIANNIFSQSLGIAQFVGNGLLLLLFIILNGTLDATLFCIPALSFSSILTESKDDGKGKDYLVILIKVYLLTHLPLKFVEYSQIILTYYHNFGIHFLSSNGFLLALQIGLIAWFSFSIARSIRKLLAIEKKYEMSLALGVFGWFNLISMAVEVIIGFLIKVLVQYHF